MVLEKKIFLLACFMMLISTTPVQSASTERQSEELLEFIIENETWVPFTTFAQGRTLTIPAQKSINFFALSADIFSHDFVLMHQDPTGHSFILTVKGPDLQSSRIRIRSMGANRYTIESLQIKPEWHKVPSSRRNISAAPAQQPIASQAPLYNTRRDHLRQSRSNLAP